MSMPIAASVSRARKRAPRLRAAFRAAGWLALCAHAPRAQAAPPAVLTQHNDNARTGANAQETALTPANLSVTTFGKLFTRTLDADVNGQVLYVPGVTINGVVHNVIYAYTSKNSDNSKCSLYAYDADDPSAVNPLWHHVLPNSARWTTCTPVIDPAAKIIYVLTKGPSNNDATYLRAFDITTGDEKIAANSPLLVAASVPGNGDGSSGGVVSFDTTHANCRPGLLLLNGVVYCAFAHNSDSFPYHGWILGYQFGANGFTQTAVFCTNPNGGDDGIWQAGKGLAADASSIYCSIGNGTFDANTKGITPTTSYGMCYLKLNAADLTVTDWFASYDEKHLSDQDLDTGNSGPLLIPGASRLFGGGTKFGSVFLMDANNLGKFKSAAPDNVVQRFDNVTKVDQVGQNPVCWDTGGVKYVYLWPTSGYLTQFLYDPAVGKFVTSQPTGYYKQATPNTFGGSLAVSANGGRNGILWGVDYNRVVHAFDATDVSKPEIWNSGLNASRDGLPSTGHFQFPTVVNGKVYVPTGSSSIVAYGLLPTTVSGVVALDNLSPAAPAQTITFTLRPTDGTASSTRVTAVGPDGAFSLGAIAAKTYTLHVQGDRTLAVNLPLDATSGPVTLGTITLPGGDANGDNSVDNLDLGLLASAYGSASGDSNFDARADFNGDGSVDNLDLAILANNYGLSGDN